MAHLDEDFAAGVFDNPSGPCLSLYQPTHRHLPDREQDRIRFGNLVKSLEESLLKVCSKREAGPLLEPFEALGRDHGFWMHTLDGLAALGTSDVFRVYRLQRPVGELAVAANTFHIKPLLRIMQSADRFQVLAVSRKDMRLFEGNRDVLDEIEPHPDVPRTLTDALGSDVTEPMHRVTAHGGLGAGTAPLQHGGGGKESEVDIDAERYFRAVDRAVLEHHSRPSGMPLILAALPEHHKMFHTLSKNPHLVAESLDVHPDALPSIDDLRGRAWQVLLPHYVARLDGFVEAFGAARAAGLGEADPANVARAVVEGRVATLLIEAERRLPGHVDAVTGALAPAASLHHPTVDDVLDDLAEMARRKGGEVIVVPAERMPTDTGLAAIYRF